VTSARTRTEPTKRDLQVLQLVRRHYRRHGCAPTRAEIGSALGISRPTADGHLQALAQSGLVVLRKEWRGVYLTKKAAS